MIFPAWTNVKQSYGIFKYSLSKNENLANQPTSSPTKEHSTNAGIPALLAPPLNSQKNNQFKEHSTNA
jgi:hypothetical protein